MPLLTRALLGLFGALGLLTGVVSCGKATGGIPQSGNASVHPQPHPAADMEPLTVAEGTAELNGIKATIRVRMIRGKEVADPNPGPFQGTYLQGEFETDAITQDGKERGSYRLNDAFDGAAMRFRKEAKPFSLRFEDYNGDGNPDFTIGQWGGSNGNIYSILTLGPNGFGVLQKNIYSSDHSPSIKYRKVGSTAFVNQYYDQRKGFLDVVYRWKDGAFHEDEPVKAQEIHAAGGDE